MDVLVAGDHGPGLEDVLLAVAVGRKSARLAHHDDARGHVPGCQTHLPQNPSRAAGGHIGQVQCGRTEAPDAGGLGHGAAQGRPARGRDCRGPRCGMPVPTTLSSMRERAATRMRRSLTKAPPPRSGRVELVHGGIVDNARDQLALALRPIDTCKKRDAVQEVRRAV